MSVHSMLETPLTVVVGSGGVGKTTVAAALALEAARRGHGTLVMTFDPSLRLRDTLGVDDRARVEPARVACDTRGALEASLLDAGRTFDGLIEKYAPDPAARARILENRYYKHLSGTLAGILEYMAVERLYEVAHDGRYDRIVLDTPPTAQALDFLEAPQRIVQFLDSGAVQLATRNWFDEEGRFRPSKRFGFLGRKLEEYLDHVVGLGLLREMAEFFQAFGPLYDGFRRRADKVQSLLASAETEFVLVTGPGEERVPETMFFARKLLESGHAVGPLIVNRLHDMPSPEVPPGADAATAAAVELFTWLIERDRAGLETMRELLGETRPLIPIPLLETEPADLPTLERFRGVLFDSIRRAAV